MIHSGWTSSTLVGSGASGTGWTSSTSVRSGASGVGSGPLNQLGQQNQGPGTGLGSATCSGSRAGASGFWGATNVIATGLRSVASMVLAVAAGETAARCNAAILDSCGFCFVLCSLALASATTA